MPVIATHLLTNGDGTDASSYLTASITPPANKLILAGIVNLKSGGATTPTLSGAGMTWTQVNTVAVDILRVTLFRALSSSPASGSVTVDFSGNTQLRTSWSFSAFGIVDTKGTNGSIAVVQNATNSSQSQTSLTVTLAGFANSNNATYGVMGINDAQTITAGTGFTQLGQTSIEFSTIQSQWKNTNDTTVDWTFPSILNQAGIAVEIKFLPSSGNLNSFEV